MCDTSSLITDDIVVYLFLSSFHLLPQSAIDRNSSYQQGLYAYTFTRYSREAFNYTLQFIIKEYKNVDTKDKCQCDHQKK